MVRGGVIPKLIDFIYPLGSVIQSTNKLFDPNVIYKHQTWERFAKGKTIVGVDEDDADFAAAEMTGGEKVHKLTTAEMPSHAGHITPMAGTANGKYLPTGSMATYGSAARGWYSPSGGEWYPSNKSIGSTTAHNNMQPYVTVYYWHRTA